jgi:hypothetical protein
MLDEVQIVQVSDTTEVSQRIYCSSPKKTVTDSIPGTARYVVQ